MVTAEALRIAELGRRLEETLTELEDMRAQQAQAQAAIAKARTEGYEAGLVEGGRIADARIAALEKTLTQAATEATAALSASLVHLETAAGELASIALERIVGDPSTRQDLVAETIARAVGVLSADTVVEMEVSSRDFPDLARLEAVAPAGCKVRALETHPSGACRLRLRIGELDLDLDGQTIRLRALLDPTWAATS